MQNGSGIVHLLIIGLTAGLLGQVLSGLFRIPSIVFLLALGVGLGPDAAGVLDPRELGPVFEVLVRISVALILFEGGMSLRLREIRKVQLSVRRLISVGVLFTFASAAAAAHYIADLPFRHALLFGSLVTVTGPTVIRPLVQRIRLRPELAAILEGEGILADPIGAILAAVCLEYALSPDASGLVQLEEFGTRIGLGIGIGAAIGALTGLIVKYRAPSVERIKPLVVLVCALGCYGVAEMVRPESGIMAVVAAGLAIQHGVAAHDRELRDFKELITTLLLSILFVLLAANLRMDRMRAEGWPGLVTVLAVMLVIRPLNIFICTRGGVSTIRERVFLSWVAPRGIIAAGVASLGALILEKGGDPLAHRVESLVFLAIFLTVILQGGSAKLVARLLGVMPKGPRGVLIVGANPIARRVAAAFKSAGQRVTLIDRSPAFADQARDEGLDAVCGDATDRDTQHLAGLDEADVLVALTGSTVANQTAAQVAIHDRRPDQVWVALSQHDRQQLDPVLDRAGAEIAFARAIPFQRWQIDFDEGKARFATLEVTSANAPAQRIGDTYFAEDVVPVLVDRKGEVRVVSRSTRLAPGDRLTVLTRVADDAALKSLGIEPHRKSSGRAAPGK